MYSTLDVLPKLQYLSHAKTLKNCQLSHVLSDLKQNLDFKIAMQIGYCTKPERGIQASLLRDNVYLYATLLYSTSSCNKAVLLTHCISINLKWYRRESKGWHSKFIPYLICIEFCWRHSKAV